MKLLLISLIAFQTFGAFADKRSVDLAWGPVEGATAYELKIKSVTRPNSNPLFFKTKKAQWTGKIRPGEYEMNIRSYDKRQVPGPWSDKINFWAKVPPPVLIEPKNKTVIESPVEGGLEVKFVWKNPYMAPSFKLIVSSPESGFEKIEDVAFDGFNITSSAEAAVTLPVGLEYKWMVQAVHSDNSLGDLTEKPHELVILAPPLKEPKLLQEKSEFMRILTWEQIPEATAYGVRVLRVHKGKWNVVLHDKDRAVPEVEMPLDHLSGRYRLEVQAKAAGRKPSSIVKEDFILKGGFR